MGMAHTDTTTIDLVVAEHVATLIGDPSSYSLGGAARLPFHGDGHGRLPSDAEAR